jgi:hypothetical protein
MAAAAMARCGKSLDEPSYIEHPFQQRWLPFDSDAPAEPDAQRQSDAEVAVTIAATSVNSALLAALVVACAFSVIATGNPLGLSQQQISSCTPNPQGCPVPNLYFHSNVG